MTNESIFYVVGLILGFTLGYATKSLRSRNKIIKIVIKPKKGSDDEQRRTD